MEPRRTRTMVLHRPTPPHWNLAQLFSNFTCNGIHWHHSGAAYINIHSILHNNRPHNPRRAKTRPSEVTIRLGSNEPVETEQLEATPPPENPPSTTTASFDHDSFSNNADCSTNSPVQASTSHPPTASRLPKADTIQPTNPNGLPSSACSTQRYVLYAKPKIRRSRQAGQRDTSTLIGTHGSQEHQLG